MTWKRAFFFTKQSFGNNTHFVIWNVDDASITFSLLYNAVGLSIAASGLMSPLVAAIFMPLSSVTVAVLSFTQVNFKSKKLGLLRARL